MVAKAAWLLVFWGCAPIVYSLTAASGSSGVSAAPFGVPKETSVRRPLLVLQQVAGIERGDHNRSGFRPERATISGNRSASGWAVPDFAPALCRRRGCAVDDGHPGYLL